MITARSRLCLVLAGVVCAMCGLFAAALYAVYFSRQPGQDWMVYYTAGRAALDGNLTLLFDGDRLTTYMNVTFADWLKRPLTFHPWLYPPHTLFFLTPFGLLSFTASYVLFELVTFGGLVAALWTIAERGWQRWLQFFSLLLAPTASFTLGLGQNAFLSTAFLVGGFGLIGRSPYLAGMLLGLLTFKPQLWLMVPVALVAAREWRVLGVTVASAAVATLASAAVFGIEPWRVWIEWVVNPPAEAYQNYQTWNHLADESVYTNLFMAHAPAALAKFGQIAAGLLAIGCVWWSYRRERCGQLQLVVVLAATTLAAPHVANYDMVMLTVAATVLFANSLAQNAGWIELMLPPLVWIMQLFNPPGAFAIGVVTPLLTCALIACAMVRIGSPLSRFARAGQRAASANLVAGAPR